MTTGREHGWPSGTPIHGVLQEETDASAGIEIPMYTDTGGRYHVGTADQLNVIVVSAVTTAGGNALIYADFAGRASITSASTSTDTLAVAGDITHILSVDSTFYVQGSTGNDGEYTVTSISYDAPADTTTVGVTTVADATADGVLAWVYFAIADADSTGNTFAVAGDQRDYFKVGRLFKVDGSTGNDNGGTDYTVTAATYSTTTLRTTVSVAAVADDTDDGYIIPQFTSFAANRYAFGNYQAQGGQVRPFGESRIPLRPGYTLVGVAAAGDVDFETQAFLRRGNLL